MVINFKQMSVNREEFCHEVTDILNNSKTGDRYEGYGVVSFPVEAVLSLRHETPGVGQAPAVVATATVRHDVADEPCNYSHSVVHGSVDGRELALGQDLSHTARMRLRFQIWRFVTTEIPADMAGENLDDESWQ